MTELLAIPYSPWSEKARWALDLRGVSYRARSYQPLLGEPELRVLLKRFRGPVSVPLLRTDGRVINDSFEIAKYADRNGSGPALFPAGREAEIARYNELSERALAAGRALSLARMLESREALLEMVPRALHRPLGPLAEKIAAAGIRRTLRKYGADRASLEEHRRTLLAALDQLRADLGKAKDQEEPRTLLGELSYADLAMAQVLAFVEPPQAGLRLGKASRLVYRDGELAALYPDLVVWRDALYAKYRRSGR